MFSRLAAAAHRRMQNAAGDDSGFALLYVLMIGTILTVLTGTTLVATSGDVVPSVKNSFDQAAYSAAQGGLQAFVAYVDQTCANQNSSVATCSLPMSYSGVVPIYSASGYSASYAWQATADPSNRYFRVRSTGTVSQGGVTAHQTLVGDVSGGASTDLLNYGVVTGFETESPTAILSDYQKRTIAINAATAAYASGPVRGGSITWNGASPGTAAGKLAVCNMPFGGVNGRSNDRPPGAPNPYVDWSESSVGGNKFTNYQSCSVSMSQGTKLLAPANPADGNGGYYTSDALLLSNSYPGGTGPLVNQPVTTQYQYSPTDGACGTVGQPYRSFNLVCAGWPVEVGGSPDPTSKYGIQWVASGPTIPTSSAVVPTNACVYNGPTRVRLNADGTATVTSPQTTATWVAANPGHPSQCYAGAIDGTGMTLSTVNLTTPTPIPAIDVVNSGNIPPATPALAHGSTGWPTGAQKLGTTASTSNSVFWMTSGVGGTTTSSTVTTTAADKPYAPAVGDNPSAQTDGAWTPQWTTMSGTSGCTTSTPVTDLRFFDCNFGSGTDAYSAFKNTVKNALAQNPTAYNTASSLQTYLSGRLAAGNSADANNAAPSATNNTSHRWKVSVVQDSSTTDGCTPASNVTGSTTNTAISPPTSDPFFANTAGNSASTPTTTTTCLTATVTAQIGTCNVALVAGLCVNLGDYVWGNGTALLGGGQSVAQFKLTVKSVSTSTSTTVTQAVSSFPNMADITQYSMGTNGTFGNNGPGDLYVEGTSKNSIALIAANDLLVTGNLAPADTTNGAVQAVAYNDVRVYHPVKCASTDPTAISTTDPGWCPNDLTGMYNTTLPSTYRPDQQYVNMRPDLANLTIRGALFALGIPQSNVSCPSPAGANNAVCGGQFAVDNYNRGSGLSTLLVVGTIAMAHHGPAGQEWEVPDQRGLTSRPYSGYQLSVQYQNLKNALAGINPLTTMSSTSSGWHVISVSTGTTS